MGWLRKNLKKAGKKLKKFFKTDVGKVVGTVALAVAGFYLFGPAAVAGGVPTVTATSVPLATGAAATGTGVVTATSVPLAGTAAATGIPTVTATSVPLGGATTTAGASTATKVASTTSGATTVEALKKGAGDAVTRGSGVATLGNTAGTTQPFGNNELATTLIDRANLNVANGNHMISNNLTNATTDVLNLNNGKSKTGIKFDKDFFNTADVVDSDKKGWYLGKKMGLPKDNLLQASKTKIGEALTSDYAIGTAQGVTASVLTSAILGPGGEQDGGGGQVVAYDKSIGNAQNYINDISQTYQQNTGQPLTFNMFTQNSTPLYGPSSPQNLARNPFLT